MRKLTLLVALVLVTGFSAWDSKVEALPENPECPICWTGCYWQTGDCTADKGIPECASWEECTGG
jgi:hypothetical protein